MQSVGATLVKLIATATSGLVSFTTNVIRPVKVTCKFSPVREGTGNPSPDNVRPISGWESCLVYHARKNMLSTTDQGYGNYTIGPDGSQIESNDRITTGYIPCNENVFLTFSTNKNTGLGPSILMPFAGIAAFDKDKNFISRTSGNDIRSKTFETPTATKYIRVFEQIRAADKPAILTPAVFSMYQQQLEFGETYTNYEEPSGQSLPITFTDPSTGDPLTVYGGTVTLNEDGSVNLIVNKLKRTYIGSSSEQWSKYGSGSASAFAMQHPLSNFANTDGAIIADYLVTIERNATWGNRDNWVSWVSPNGLITGIKSITTVAAWKAYLAENPLTIVYNLKSSLSYRLDNVGQLQSFLETNNIWHNMNGSITVEYWNKQ